MDLAVPEQFDTVIADIREHWGDIDILVNNSGGPPPTLAQGRTAPSGNSNFQ
ncbi:hypothetical protein LNP26_27625 [Klebsiella variicola subsp. variicola]|nr:hypothetical protein [Klebsiella variicola subsp. variicola]